MSEGEFLPTSVPFTRGCKARASLPTARSSYQTRERIPGVLFLQYGGETKQVIIQTEINSEDFLRSLFVSAFPHQLSMKMLLPPNMAICIKDTKRNVYYDLENLRDITSNSCLKAYHKDPVHVFNQHARPANTEGTLSKELLYGSHSPVHRRPSSSRNHMHSLQGSMSPPMVRSMPSSPSRVAYSGSIGKKEEPGRTTTTRDSQPGRAQSSCMFSSSSAILERRDVKPDADISKSPALVLYGDGGSHFPEYYRSASVDVGGSRHSTSSYCSSPPVLTGRRGDVGLLGIPAGLQQYKATIKRLTGYGESMENHSNSVHGNKNRKHEDSRIHPVGLRSPHPVPRRGNEVRTINGQAIGGASMSPIHRSLEYNSCGPTADVINRRGSSSSNSSVFLDSPLGQLDTQFPAPITASNTQSERMKAMEEQIASLAGLVHHALSAGSDVLGQKETISRSEEHKLHNNHLEASSDSTISAALTEGISPTPLARFDGGLRQNMMSVKRNICELRLQLSQLKCLQLSNLESVSSMLRMAAPELVMLMCEKLSDFKDESYRQRAEMDEDRIHYLTSEDNILTQLSELEDFVDSLDSSSSFPGQPSLTLRDVEEGAVSLRRLGESLAVLKGEFPVLQAKMRSVLRLEVEAVRFLKEEPHKMDSMLKRVKGLTESLSSLRRRVSESTPSKLSAKVEPLKAHNLETAAIQSPLSSPKPQPRHSVKAVLPKSSPSLLQVEVTSLVSASPITARRLKSTATSSQLSGSPTTTSHGPNSATIAKNTRRQTPEASLCSSNKTSRDSQPARRDPSHTQPSDVAADCIWVHQETPSVATQFTMNLSENRDGFWESASERKSLLASASKPDTDVGLTGGADISDTHRNTISKHIDDVESRKKRNPNSAPADVADAPPAVCPGSESSRRPQVEKPRRSGDKRQASKAPLSPQRSGEPIIISSKDSDGTQVSKEISQIIHLPSGNKENSEEQGKTPPSVFVARKLEHRSDSAFKLLVAGEVEEPPNAMLTRSFAKLREIQQVSCLNCASVDKGEMEVSTNPAKQKEDITTNMPDQCRDKSIISSAAVEKKLQKGQNSSTSPKTTKTANAEKSRVMLALSVQKEHIPGDSSLQENQLLGSKPQQESEVVKPFPSSEDASGQSSAQQEQQEASQVFSDQEVFKEGHKENFTTRKEGPTPVSVQPEIIHRSSRTHISSQFEEPPGNTKDFEGTDMKYVYNGFTEDGSDDLVLFFNDPEYTESIYEPLSTIFECEEEDHERVTPNRTLEKEPELGFKSPTDADADNIGHHQPSSFCDSVSERHSQDQTNSGTKTGPKKKFKIKLPKNKLAALSEAIRTGTRRGGKSASKIAEQEQEPTTDNRPVNESKKASEVTTSKQFLKEGSSNKEIITDTGPSRSHPQVDALCKNAFDSINSLEESIKQLELSMESITTSSDAAQPKGAGKLNDDRSPSKRAAAQNSKGPNPPQSKKVRAQPLQSSTRKQVGCSAPLQYCHLV